MCKLWCICGSYIIVVMVKFRVNLSFDWDEYVTGPVHNFGVKKCLCIFPF